MNKFLKLLIINSITFVRIIGTFFILFYKELGGITIGLMTIVIYFSDIVDGALARRWKCSTFFGALFDGAADKLFTIVNFFVLYMIVKDIALIPILIELLICVVQLIKYSINMGIKSNNIGKLKIWILAICTVLTYFASDIDNITILGQNFINSINAINNNELYLIILSPAILMEAATLISYIVEFFLKKNIEASMKETRKIDRVKLNNKKRIKYIESVWLNPEFYEKHKNDTNLKDLRKESKKKII